MSKREIEQAVSKLVEQDDGEEPDFDLGEPEPDLPSSAEDIRFYLEGYLLGGNDLRSMWARILADMGVVDEFIADVRRASGRSIQRVEDIRVSRGDIERMPLDRLLYWRDIFITGEKKKIQQILHAVPFPHTLPGWIEPIWKQIIQDRFREGLSGVGGLRNAESVEDIIKVLRRSGCDVTCAIATIGGYLFGLGPEAIKRQIVNPSSTFEARTMSELATRYNVPLTIWRRGWDT